MLTKSSLEQFSRDLIATGELDPMYDLIDKGFERYGSQWANQYALHLFMYYDAGQAAALANATTELDFWHMQHYGYPDFKRGTERRHFRGDKGLKAMQTLQHMGSPTSVWNKMHSSSYTGLVNNVETRFGGCQIGPYFTWKAMDILDRCLGVPVSLSLGEAVKYLPDEPRKCAKTLWPTISLPEVLLDIREMIKDLPAPGAKGKLCGFSEVETILCAVNSLVKGSYRFGQDIDRRHNELRAHPSLLKLLPEKQDWSKYVYTMDTANVPA